MDGGFVQAGEAGLNPARKRRRNRGRTLQNSHCLSVGRRGRQTDPEVGRPISSSLWVGRRFLLAMPASEAVNKAGRGFRPAAMQVAALSCNQNLLAGA